MKLSVLLLLPLTLALPDGAALAQPGALRGMLLYATHCKACHSSNVHWRERKLATDVSSLRREVRRWQNSADLRWTEEEIEDVVSYLNLAFYGFPVGGLEGLLEEELRFRTHYRVPSSM